MSHRPFANLAEMHETMIRRWNRVVRPKDEVFIVGDFLYKGSAKEVRKKPMNYCGA